MNAHTKCDNCALKSIMDGMSQQCPAFSAAPTCESFIKVGVLVVWEEIHLGTVYETTPCPLPQNRTKGTMWENGLWILHALCYHCCFPGITTVTTTKPPHHKLYYCPHCKECHPHPYLCQEILTDGTFIPIRETTCTKV
jgi:hypothetical protein